jgi:hypothetical protein
MSLQIMNGILIENFLILANNDPLKTIVTDKIKLNKLHKLSISMEMFLIK